MNGKFRAALFTSVANMLSFDDLRRAFLAIVARTGIKDVVVRTPDGVFTVDIRDRIISWSIIARQTWEPEETKILTSLLQPGDTVIDAGANIGWHTVLMAKRVGEAGHVFAIEPDPNNFRLLERNIQENNQTNVTVFNAALAEQRGTLHLSLDDENFGDHHIAAHAPAGRQTVSVQSMPLDEITAGVERIRLLKMDCQGFEPSIVRGATETLKKCEYVVTEYWPAGIARAGFDAKAYLDTFKPLFSRFRRVREGSESFLPIEGLDRDAALITGEEGRNDATDYLFAR